jgi:outer membrane usher protein
MGRTNRWGDLLVPDLFPYVENRLSITDSDLPLNYTIQTAARTLAPPYRGGAVILFPAAQVHVFQGRVVIADGDKRMSPAYGTMTVNLSGATIQSPLSADGDFYFENLAPGTYQATVESDAGSCRFNLQIQKATTLTTSIGTIECHVR